MAGLGRGGGRGGGVPGRGRAGRQSPGPHPVRCSRCGHRVARRGTWGRRHCDSGSSPPSGSTGRGPSQNWWLCSVLGDKGAPAVEWGLLSGPPAAQACAHGPSSGGHQLSQPPRDGAKASPLPHSLQGAASSSEWSPQLSSPSHSWGGSTQASFRQRWCPRGQCAWGAGGGVNPSPAPSPRAGPLTRASCRPPPAPGVGPRPGDLTGQPAAPEGHVVQGHGAPVGGISRGREGHLERAKSLSQGPDPPRWPHRPACPSHPEGTPDAASGHRQLLPVWAPGPCAPPQGQRLRTVGQLQPQLGHICSEGSGGSSGPRPPPGLWLCPPQDPCPPWGRLPISAPLVLGYLARVVGYGVRTS